MALGEVCGRWILAICCFSALQLSAKEVEKINFADQLDLGAQKLVLNGAGLRTKRKLGMNFRVYVGGLYTVKKSSDAKALIASEDPKVIRMVFLRSLDRDTLQEAMEEGFKKNCKLACETMASALKSYNELMVKVKENDELKIQFDKDSVTVEIKGKETHSGKIEGANFSKNLLAVYIGDEPPTEEFKNALLGK